MDQSDKEVALKERRARGAKAAELLREGSLLSESFDEMSAGIFEMMKKLPENATPDDVYRLWLRLKMLTLHESWLKSVMQDGRMAADELTRQEAEAERRQQNRPGSRV